MESTRKLLEGERVEVRQKEVGLRGSWHLGVVMKVKNGRRIVEYDEFLTRDGERKLQEVISLEENCCSKTSTAVDNTVRGFIRPLPRGRYLSSVRSPKKGLLVDAFYEHAWWEGVLLHDVLNTEKDFKVKILFPEEGDELLCSIKDVRVSQEWDEMSGRWMMRGSWSYRGNNGEFDIDCLRDICRNRWSHLKKLWRQKTVSVAHDDKTSKKTTINCLNLGNATALPLVKNDKQGITSKCNSGQQSICVVTSKCKRGDTTRRSLEENGDVNNSGLLNLSSSTKFSLKDSRSAARKFLLDAGWKIGFRIRKAGLHQGDKYHIYTAPDGINHYSIAAACRVWKKSGNLSSSLEEGRSQRLKLLDAYSLAQQFMSLGKRKSKAKSGQVEKGHLHKKWKGTRKGFHNAVVGYKVRKSATISYTKLDKMKNKATGGAKTAKKRKSLDTETGIGSKSSCTVKLKKKRCNDELSGQKGKKGRLWSNHKVSCPESKDALGRGGCRMQVLLSSPVRHKNSKKGQIRTEAAHFKKSTVLSWLIDKGILKDAETVRYLSRRDGHVMKKGAVTREGILCKCCKSVFTLSNFEAHAGSKLHRPSANIFLDDGRSITDCQLQACALQDVKEENLADVSDDTCGICADGGELILCDHCPSTFHPDCIGLESVPDGDWYCPRCSCGSCRQIGMDENEANEMYRCDQCELGYHSFCVPKSVLLKPQSKAIQAWFCGHQCEQIFMALRNLVGKVNVLDNGYSWMLLRSMQNDVALSPSRLETMAEHNVKLGVAHDVMQECFVPMIDPRTKINLISQALYNRKSRVSRLDYGGFYTVILEKEDEMITVAAIRVHGGTLAEMPLVGTRYQYRRQGMCRRLMQAIEQMLESIGVKKLVLPAVPELLETWTVAFHFQHMTAIETQELGRFKLMTFPGTTLLQKQVRKELAVMHASDNINEIDKHLKIPVDAGVCNMISLTSLGCIDLCNPAEGTSLCQKESYHESSSLSFQRKECSTHATIQGLHSSLSLAKDGTAEKSDEVQYGRVLRAATRSKRLHSLQGKPSLFMTVGLKELANNLDFQKHPDETNPSAGISSNSDQKALASHYQVSNVNNLAASESRRNSSNFSEENAVGNSMLETGFDFSPVHYRRRKRSKQHEEENDLTMIDCG